MIKLCELPRILSQNAEKLKIDEVPSAKRIESMMNTEELKELRDSLDRFLTTLNIIRKYIKKPIVRERISGASIDVENNDIIVRVHTMSPWSINAFRLYNHFDQLYWAAKFRLDILESEIDYEDAARLLDALGITYEEAREL